MSGGQMGSTAQPPATLRDGPTCTGQRGLLGAGWCNLGFPLLV